MDSLSIRLSAYHLYLGPQNTRLAASESAIGKVQISPARGHFNEAPDVTNGETDEECS